MSERTRIYDYSRGAAAGGRMNEVGKASGGSAKAVKLLAIMAVVLMMGTTAVFLSGLDDDSTVSAISGTDTSAVSGRVGTSNVTFVYTWDDLNEKGTLRFSGYGYMPDSLTDGKQPWYNLKVTHIAIDYRIRSISANAFKDMETLTYATIPSSVETIGAAAFKGCSALEDVCIYKASSPTLGDDWCATGIDTNVHGCSWVTTAFTGSPTGVEITDRMQWKESNSTDRTGALYHVDDNGDLHFFGTYAFLYSGFDSKIITPDYHGNYGSITFEDGLGTVYYYGPNNQSFLAKTFFAGVGNTYNSFVLDGRNYLYNATEHIYFPNNVVPSTDAFSYAKKAQLHLMVTEDGAEEKYSLKQLTEGDRYEYNDGIIYTYVNGTKSLSCLTEYCNPILTTESYNSYIGQRCLNYNSVLSEIYSFPARDKEIATTGLMIYELTDSLTNMNTQGQRYDALSLYLPYDCANFSGSPTVGHQNSKYTKICIIGPNMHSYASVGDGTDDRSILASDAKLENLFISCGPGDDYSTSLSLNESSPGNSTQRIIVLDHKVNTVWDLYYCTDITDISTWENLLDYSYSYNEGSGVYTFANFYTDSTHETHATNTSATLPGGTESCIYYYYCPAAHSGTIGDTGLSWGLYTIGQKNGSNDDLYQLRIWGSGAMPDYDNSENKAPWAAYRSQIYDLCLSNSITKIGAYAFYGCSAARSLIVPTDCASIGAYAFSGCTALDKLVFPSTSITTIGASAFQGCTSLTNVTLQGSTTAIGASAFQGCTALESAYIPRSVTSIGASAFQGCSSLSEIKITSITAGSVTVGNLAFDTGYGSGSDVVTLLISDSVGTAQVPDLGSYSAKTKLFFLSGSAGNSSCGNGVYWYVDSDYVLQIIGSGTMADYDAVTGMSYDSTVKNNASINKVAIAESVTGIGMKNFYDYSYLTTVELTGSSNRSIGQQAFEDSALESIDLTYVTSVGASAFKNTKLTEAVIPSTVDFSTNTEVFANTTTLTTLTLPIGITDKNLFGGCTALSDITVTGTGSSLDYTLTYSNAPWNQALSNGDVTEIAVTLPSGLTSVGDYMFFLNTKLKDIEIPDTVTTIGEKSFNQCTGLASASLSTALTSIGQDAFKGCTALKEMYVTDTVTTIGTSAFEGCAAMDTLVFGSALATIGEAAFKDCIALTGIALPGNVSTIGASAFSGCYGVGEIYILRTTAFESTNLGDGCFDIGTSEHPNTDLDHLVPIYLFNTAYNTGGYVRSTDSVSNFPNKTVGTYTILNADIVELTNYAQCGVTLFYKLTESPESSGKYTLSFLGSGASFNMSRSAESGQSGYIPWKANLAALSKQLSDITAVKLSSGITGLGTDLFYGLSGCVSYDTNGAHLRSIGAGCFEGSSIPYVIAYSDTTSHNDAFSSWEGDVYVIGDSESLGTVSNGRIIVAYDMDVKETRNHEAAYLLNAVYRTSTSATKMTTVLTAGNVYYACQLSDISTPDIGYTASVSSL